MFWPKQFDASHVQALLLIVVLSLASPQPSPLAPHAPALPAGRQYIEERRPARLTTWQDAELEEWDQEEW